MTWDQRLGLWGNIAAIKAARQLESLTASGTPISAGYCYQLTLTATGDRRKAERAFMTIRHAELRSGTNDIR